MTNQNVKVNLQFSADTSQAINNINSLKSLLNNISSNTRIGVDGSSIDKAVQSAQQLNLSLEKAINVNTGQLDLTKLNNSLSQAGTNLNTLSNNLMAVGSKGQQAFLKLATAVSQAETPMYKMNKTLASMGTTLLNTIKWSISSAAINAFTGSIRNAISHAKALDSALNDIRIVSGLSTEEMARFAEKASIAAEKLNTTTVAYSKAALIFYQQGLSGDEIEKRVDSVIKMAHVTGQTAEVVSSQLTAIWNNFDDGTKSLEYYADVLTKLGAATAASTDEIAKGMEKFAATADVIGLSYETAAAAVATVVAETRQSADVVGTAFKTIFARIQGLSLGETLEDGVNLNKYSEALETVGVEVLKANGELRDAGEILDDLGEKWNTLSRQEQVALAQTTAGLRQYSQFIALMDNWNTVEINMDLAIDSEGTLDEQQKIWEQSLEGSAERLKKAKEELYESFIDDDTLKGLNNTLTALVKTITRMVDSFGGLGPMILSLAGTFSSVLFPLLTRGFQTLNGLIGNLTGRTMRKTAEMQQEMAQKATEMQQKTGLSTTEQKELQVISELLTAKSKLTLASKNMNEQQKLEAQNAMALYEYNSNLVQQYLAKKKNLEEEIRLSKAKLDIDKEIAAQRATDIVGQSYKDQQMETGNFSEEQVNEEINMASSLNQSQIRSKINSLKKQRGNINVEESQSIIDNKENNINRAYDEAQNNRKAIENNSQIKGSNKKESENEVYNNFNKKINEIEQNTEKAKQDIDTAKGLDEEIAKYERILELNKTINVEKKKGIEELNFGTVSANVASASDINGEMGSEQAQDYNKTMASALSSEMGVEVGTSESGVPNLENVQIEANVENLEKLTNASNKYKQISNSLDAENKDLSASFEKLKKAQENYTKASEKGTKNDKNAKKAKKDLEKETKDFEKTLDKLEKQLTDEAKQLGKTGKEIDQLTQDFKELKAGGDGAAEAQNRISKTMKDMSGTASNTAIGLDKMGNEMRDMMVQGGVNPEKLDGLISKWKEMGIISEDTANKIRGLDAAQKNLDGTTEKNKIGFQQVATGIATVAGQAQMAYSAINMVADAFGKEATVGERVSAVLSGITMTMPILISLYKTMKKVGIALGASETGLMAILRKRADSLTKDTATTAANTTAKVLNFIASAKWLAPVAAGLMFGAFALVTKAISDNTQKVEEDTKAIEANREARDSQVEGAKSQAEEFKKATDAAKEFSKALAVYEETGEGKDKLNDATETLISAMDIENGRLLMLTGNYKELRKAMQGVITKKAEKAKESAKNAYSAAVTSLYSDTTDWVSSGTVDGNSSKSTIQFSITEDEKDLLEEYLEDNPSTYWGFSADGTRFGTWYPTNDPSQVAAALEEFYEIKDNLSAYATQHDFGDLLSGEEEGSFFKALKGWEDNGGKENFDKIIEAGQTSREVDIDSALQAVDLYSSTNQSEYNEAYEKAMKQIFKDQGLDWSKSSDKTSERGKALINQVAEIIMVDEDFKNYENNRGGLEDLMSSNKDVKQFVESGGLEEWRKKNNLSESEALNLLLNINPKLVNLDNVTEMLERFRTSEEKKTLKLIIETAIAKKDSAIKFSNAEEAEKAWETVVDTTTGLKVSDLIQTYANLSFEDYIALTESEREKVYNYALDKLDKNLDQKMIDDVFATEQAKAQATKDATNATSFSSLQEFINSPYFNIDEVGLENEKVLELFNADTIEAIGSGRISAVGLSKPVLLSNGVSNYEFISPLMDSAHLFAAIKKSDEKFPFYSELPDGTQQRFYHFDPNSDYYTFNPYAKDVQALWNYYEKNKNVPVEQALKEEADQIENNEQAKNDFIISKSLRQQNKMSSFGIDQKELDTYTQFLKNKMPAGIKSLENYDTIVKEIALDQLIFTKGIKEIQSKWDDWNKILSDPNASFNDLSIVLPEIHEALKGILGLDDADFASLPETFAYENWNLIQQLIAGSKTAIYELRANALAEGEFYSDMASNFSTFDFEAILGDSESELMRAGVNTTQALMEKIQGVLDTNKITFDVEGRPDFSKLIDGLIALKLPATAIADILASLGATALNFEVTDEDGNIVNLGEAVQDVDSPEFQTFLTKLISGDYLFTATGEVPEIGVPEMETKDLGKSSGSKRKSNIPRFKEIDDKIEVNEREISKIQIETDFLSGVEKIEKRKEQSERTKKAVELQKIRTNQAEEYLKEDKNELFKSMDIANKALGTNFSFTINDSDGRVMNFTEILQTLQTELDLITPEYGQDWKSEKDKERAEKIQEYMEFLTDSVETYEDSADEWFNSQQEELQKLKEFQDEQLGILQEEYELKLTINDSGLKLLDYYAEKISDDVYQTAESVFIIAKQSQIAENSLAISKNSINDITEKLKNEDIGIPQALEILDTVYEDISSGLSDIIAKDKEMMEAYENALSSFNEEFSDKVSLFESFNSELEHYKNLAGLLGKVYGVEFEKRLINNQISVQKDAIASNKSYFDFMNSEYEALYERWKNEADSLGEKEKELLEQKLEDARLAATEAKEVWLTSIEEISEYAEALLDLALEEAGKNFAEKLFGENESFDSIQDSLDKLNTQQEEFLTTTNKVYETNKLIRQAQQAMDKTENAMAKKKYQAYIDQIENLQNTTQLSKFQLSLAQADFEILQAKIALEDARNAKSTVRLSRDAEGNYGYVYTANEDKVSDAEQKLEDTENKKYNTLLDGAKDYQDKSYQLLSQYNDDLAALDEEYRNSDTMTKEEYEQRKLDLEKWYLDQLQVYNELYYMAHDGMVANSAELEADYLLKGVVNIQTFQQASRTYIMETSKAFNEYQETLDYINQEVGQDLDNLANGTNEITKQSKDLRDEINNKVIPALKDEALNVRWATSEWGKQRDELYDNVIPAYEELLGVLSDVMKLMNGGEGLDFSEFGSIVDTFGTDSIITDMAMNSIDDYADEIASLLNTGEYDWDDDIIKDLLKARWKKINNMTEAERKGVGLDFNNTEIQWSLWNQDLMKKLGYTGNDWNYFNNGYSAEEQNKYMSISSNKEEENRTTNAVAWERIQSGYKIIDGINGWNNREQKLKEKGYSNEEINKIFEYIKYIYGTPRYSISKTKELMGYDTGGYTGAWGPEGRLAMLHEKELVLNAEDTSNFLTAISMLRSISELLDQNALITSLGLSSLQAFTLSQNNAQTLQQEVTIHAEFPNVQDHNEIELALADLVNAASQYANRK